MCNWGLCEDFSTVLMGHVIKLSFTSYNIPIGFMFKMKIPKAVLFGTETL